MRIVGWTPSRFASVYRHVTWRRDVVPRSDTTCSRCSTDGRSWNLAGLPVGGGQLLEVDGTAVFLTCHIGQQAAPAAPCRQARGDSRGDLSCNLRDWKSEDRQWWNGQRRAVLNFASLRSGQVRCSDACPPACACTAAALVPHA